MPTLTRVPAAVNFNGDPMFIEIETDKMTGSTAPYTPTEPNLSCYVEVWMIRGNTETLIMVQSLPYSRYNKKCQADLSGLLPLAAMIPPRSSIYLASILTSSGTIAPAAARLKIKFNDMYGAPAAQPSTVISSDLYSVVHGASMYWQGFKGSSDARFLHSMFDITGKSIIKEVKRKQPEYIYYYDDSGATRQVQVRFRYTDQTESVHNVAYASSSYPYSVCYLAAGWNQLHLDNYVSSSKKLQYYSITIAGIADTLYYRLYDHEIETDQYFIFDNGCGGCEVVRFDGYHEIQFSGTKDIFTKARSSGSDFQSGLAGIHNGRGSEEWKVSTGHITQEYARHLQQMCIAECWYIDRIRKSFVKCQVKNDSIKLFKYSDDLHSIELNIKFEERSSATFFNI